MFNGAGDILRGVINRSSSILESNKAINTLGGTLDAVMSGTRQTLEGRIRNNKELNKKYGMIAKLDKDGNVMQDKKGNVIMEKRNEISATDLASSLLYNKEGNFKPLRAAAAGVLPVAGGISIISDD